MKKLIITKEEALKKYSKEFINLVIDTAKPIEHIFGMDVLVTSEKIDEAIFIETEDIKKFRTLKDFRNYVLRNDANAEVFYNLLKDGAIKDIKAMEEGKIFFSDAIEYSKWKFDVEEGDLK